jgi:mannose-6-phosphate isomerase-like protein (cupin superfamily)
MPHGQLEKLDAMALTRDITDNWRNFEACRINDHSVRLSAVNEGFGVDWHSHQRDELLYVVKGKLIIELEDRTEELVPGQMMAVPGGVRHRTTSAERTICLNIEHAGSSPKGDS